MKKYKNKSTEIRAIIFKRGMEDGYACYSLAGSFVGYYRKDEPIPRLGQKACIETLDGWIEVSEGDYIITDEETGKTYTCKPNIFNLLFEEIKED